MKFIGIIPARYASTRFPGKPLAILGGKTVIQRVYEKVSECLEAAYVATDDERIFDHVKSWGGNVVMTSPNHKSGTDRIEEAIEKIGGDFDVIFNIQGDEPYINPLQIEQIAAIIAHGDNRLASLCKQIHDYDELVSPNAVKVVLDVNGKALYFSRHPIPFMRNVPDVNEWLSNRCFYKHIGIYAYRTDTLREIASLPQSGLEKAESLEQLRWLENGYKIKVGYSDCETIGIDTPSDLENAERLLSGEK